MNALAAVLLVGMLQDASLDEVSAKFPQPVPADRAWEMAAVYNRSIADALSLGKYDEARAWERRAQERLPFSYRSHLTEIGREFWGYLASPPRNPDHFRHAREQLLRSLGAKVNPPPVGENPQNPLLPLSQAAWILAFQGDFATALECLTAIERANPGPVWMREIPDIRKDIESLRAAKEDPEALAKLSWRVGFSGSSSHAAAFLVLKRLKASPQQAAALKAGAAYLNAIKDEAGAKAWEDMLFARKDISEDELTSIILTRSNQAFERGDYTEADAGYRRILLDWPKSKMMGRALYNLGFSLMKQKRFPEARAEFEKLLKADVNDKEPGDHIMELQRNYRPKAIVHIGECYEAEENWEMALKSYEDQRKHPMRSYCGNCSESMGIQSVTRVIRAMHRLGRHDEAMKKCREMILGPEGLGSNASEICIMAVDIAVTQGGVDDFEKELKSKGDQRRPRLALNYLHVLRLRASGDHSGLFDVMQGAGGLRSDPHSWKEARRRQPVAIEAAECLGELGDAAFDWLCEKVRNNADKELALIAIAHFKTAKALDFIRNLSVRPHTNDAYEVRCLEQIHAEPFRARSYPPRQIQKQDVGVGSTAVVLAFLALTVITVRRLKRGRRTSGASRIP